MSACMRSQARRGLIALLVVVFVVVQAAALAHEVQHALHLHHEPCGLHLVADHLAMALAPEPAPAVELKPAIEQGVPFSGARLSPPARPSAARAPPFRS
jgi:hypothetical protein